MSRDAAGAPPPAPFSFKIYWVLLALIVFVAIGPFAVNAVAHGIASANGCALPADLLYDRSIPCLIGDADYGSDLHAASLAVLLVFATLPLAFLLFVAWLLTLLVHRRHLGRRIVA